MIEPSLLVTINGSIIISSIISTITIFLEARRKASGTKDSRPKEEHLLLLYRSYLFLVITMIFAIFGIITVLFLFILSLILTVMASLIFLWYFFTLIKILSIGYIDYNKNILVSIIKQYMETNKMVKKKK